VLLVTGVLLLYGGLLVAADGPAFDERPGAIVWTSAVAGALAAWPAFARRSALCLLMAAILAGLVLAFLVRWVFDPGSAAPYRWLLLAYAGGLVLGSLAVRDTLPRHAEQLIEAAGLAIAAIGVAAILASPVGLQRAVQLLPGFWEVVLLAAGFGLLAYGALERSPGPAYLGALNTALFIAAVFPSGEPTLYWWPLVLILVGGALLAAGLRPRRPLPPEPSPYKAGDAPLAARAEEPEMVFRVRDDSR
jgi:peptidoglycan/LPS O-acetylase OafA/YrhL